MASLTFRIITDHARTSATAPGRNTIAFPECPLSDIRTESLLTRPAWGMPVFYQSSGRSMLVSCSLRAVRREEGLPSARVIGLRSSAGQSTEEEPGVRIPSREGRAEVAPGTLMVGVEMARRVAHAAVLVTHICGSPELLRRCDRYWLDDICLQGRRCAEGPTGRAPLGRNVRLLMPLETT